ncbi:MAG: hypothetical protein IKF65_03750 [Clostridia bacterium]|nr:hypothetical protein [Clostridia bacterium]
MKEHKTQNTVKPDIALLVYFGISIFAFAAGTVMFGYLAYKSIGEGYAWFFIVMTIACPACLAVLLFYHKIFADHPAEITEQGIRIGKKMTLWDDIEKVWTETVWTGRGEPHMFACFRLKDAARRKKKPKNVRFDFRIPVNKEGLALLKQYMSESRQ